MVAIKKAMPEDTAHLSHAPTFSGRGTSVRAGLGADCD
jgi:hypothetical protein